ncbi:hypothetical protein CBF34_03690 [Vagococcus penaei]|uniref:Uncharacterized protein n=1 Tax=Vagococcus penaei TaxID=633807 RepID=A0A1Q2D795_9ENTE|nr:DsrE/DsrF/DrsH-like family protein [Vagococcus penaei]AQP54244.1 hypothetical protein BW732_08430 [Vagococcus penaei]RSU05869.1 hypothetical protein CBF34_03690 [Vagococcus penaei]
MTNENTTFTYEEIPELIQKNAYLLDIRNQCERDIGYINPSFNIPLDELEERLSELPKNQTIYLYCQSGPRGERALELLTKHQIIAKNLIGGYSAYSQQPLNIPTVDVQGLQCPAPILQVKNTLDSMKDKEQVTFIASDPGFINDVTAWCQHTGNVMINSSILEKHVEITLCKRTTTESCPLNDLPANTQLKVTPDGATMVVFSGDFDRALASMIIASGAATMGKKVTVLFTFWGLSVLKKQKIKKNGLAKMFDIMLPNHTNRLPISKMNMGGLGSKMIQTVMKKKNVTSLSDMIHQAHDLGVEFIACSMSMDIMGIEASELYDFVQIGGVAMYLGEAEKANLNLFI